MFKRILIFPLILILIFVSCFSVTANTANVFTKNTLAEKKVALTFDDGPHPIYTSKIIELLEVYDITATFFVIGQNIANYPDAFKKLVESGCEIGNHTYHHKNLSDMSESDIRQELEMTEAAISSFSNIKPTLIRPPEGSFGKQLESVCIEKKYDVILWSIDTRDWEYASADQISATVLKNIQNGDIILMHDYVSHGAHTYEALKIIIPLLISKGYSFVSVSDLLYDE